MSEYVREFDCASCGRHIVMFCGQPDTTECATCQTIPGWHKNPEIARVIDPDFGKGDDSNDVVA